MPIEIAIIKSPNNIEVNKTCHTFNEQGGSIGRAPGNTWVLEDPNRYLSSKHAEILYENGSYYLLDTSTNGTFINVSGSMNPIGNGNRALLKDGDKFALSDYEFRVNIQADDSSLGTFGDPFDSGPFVTNTQSENSFDGYSSPSRPLAQDDPFGGGGPIVEPSYVPSHEETDPLAVLDKANGFGEPDAQANPFIGSQPDNVDPMNQSVNWPNAIPENWYDDEASEKKAEPTLPPPSTPPRRGAPDSQTVARLQQSEKMCAMLEAENKKLLANIAALKQQLINQQAQSKQRSATRSMNAQDQLVIDAIGFSRDNLSDAKIVEISQLAGELVRETIIGLMQVLSFRKRIKEEFRINVTTIQPIENNPLKFSANLEDALENMFLKENKAYQKPIEAVREGFSSIAEHQVAVLAGIQAAFKGVIERFDPDALEKRFEKFRKGGLVKINQKGRNWDAYMEFHKDLIDNIDNSFQHLFGYTFVQAYEEQLQKLQMTRKKKYNGNLE